MSELIGDEQLWIKDKWYAKFNRTPDLGETGVGHTAHQEKDFASPPIEVVMAYHREVLDRIESYIEKGLTETDLDRQVHSPTLI